MIFKSDLKLSLINPALQPLTERIAAFASAGLKQTTHFEPSTLIIGPDVSKLKIVPSAFSIERRTETPFEQKTYFSAAPLPTSEHLRLIEDLEAALR